MKTLWVRETEQMIEAVGAHQQELQARLDSIQQELAQVMEELLHWKAVHQSYHSRMVASSTKRVAQPLELGQYAGLSYTQIFNRVADEHNDDVPAKLLTKIFRSKAKNPRNASSAAYTTIRRLLKQGKATRVRPGLYRRLAQTVGIPNGLTVSSNHNDPQPILMPIG